MGEFGPPGHRVALQRRVARARSFLRSAVPQDTQDQTLKLLGLIWAHAPRHEVVRQQQVLSTLQRPDGGWGQMPTLSPDAYATGQAPMAPASSSRRPQPRGQRSRSRIQRDEHRQPTGVAMRDAVYASREWRDHIARFWRGGDAGYPAKG